MSTVTIFSSPKPFSDPHINVIQRNAIQSWKSLGDQVEVILIGDESGLRDTASDLGVQYIPEVERNQQKTPLVHSVFDQARQASAHEILMYLNADIILLPECLPIISRVDQLEENYLLVGRRWDLNITWEIDFLSNWIAEMERLLVQEGKLRAPSAMDYFVFPRHLFQEIPPFTIGRAGWDNWMIYYAHQQQWRSIDVTSSLRVIHQNHDYSHLPEGKSHYDLEESYQNVALSGGMATMYDLLDVNFTLKGGRIRRKRLNLLRFLRKMERLVIPDKQIGWRWSLTRFLRRSRRKLSKTGWVND